MQWLNLEPVGARLELVRRNGQWYFYARPTNLRPLAFDPSILGFKSYQNGWIKPSDWATIGQLKVIPGAQVTDLAPGVSVLNTDLSEADAVYTAFEQRQSQQPKETQDETADNQGVAVEDQAGNAAGNGDSRPPAEVLSRSVEDAGTERGDGELHTGLWPANRGGATEAEERDRGSIENREPDTEHESRNTDGDESGRDRTPAGAEPIDAEIDRFALKASTTEDSNLNPEHFFITNEIDRDGGFGRADRYRDNLDAIKTLKALVADGVRPTPGEKSIMARFSGWGGLKSIFDSKTWNNGGSRGRDQFFELKSLVSSKELELAGESILNGHFTPKGTIEAMWSLLEDMGFKGGSVWETSAGIGNFLGLAPASIVKRSKFYATEKDPLTGKMLARLYPEAQVDIKGIEETQYPDAFFDLAISNVPFGNYSVYDPDYDRHRLRIHDYCFVKALDKLKPGGVAALITSRYTLDKVSHSARSLIHDRAHLLGALRLPNTAQKAQAGTEVVTDIVFLQKRVKPRPKDETPPAWLESKPIQIDGESGSHVCHRNAYYESCPEHLLGVENSTSSQFGLDYTLSPNGDTNELKQQIIDAGSSFAKQLTWPGEKVMSEKAATEIVDLNKRDDRHPVGSFILHNDKLVVVRHYREISDLDGRVTGYQMEVEASALKGRNRDKVLALVEIRETLVELINIQLEPQTSDAQILELQANLNQRYDAFTAKYGYLNKPQVMRPFLSDPSCGRLMALENYDEEKETAEKADVFSKRVIKPVLTPEIHSHTDALSHCMGLHGRIVPEFVNELAGHLPNQHGTPIADLVAEEKIFLVPEELRYEPANLYLAGHVRQKLEYARASGPEYARHAELLESVLPEDIPKDLIKVMPGASWIPHKVFRQFIRDTMGIGEDGFTADYSPSLGTWKIRPSNFGRSVTDSYIKYGTKRVHFYGLLERLANNQPIAVYDVITNRNGNESRVINLEETIAAKEKAELIKEAMTDYIWNKDPDLGDELHRRYNELYNSYVNPAYDGSHLTFPGMNTNISFRPCQKDAAWRYLVDGRVLLGHEVGVGKTWEMVAAAMESKRLGKCNTTMIVVKNKMLDQFVRETYQLYPNATATFIDPKTTANKRLRAQFVGRVSNNNYDIVVVPYSVYEKVRVPMNYQERYIRDKIHQLRGEVLEIKSDDKSGRARFQASRIETKVRNLEARLKRALADYKKDPGINFAELGIDALHVDEAHNFKNVDANRSADMGMKIQYVQERNPDLGGLILATATPISNALDEIWVMENYLMPDLLEELNLTTLNGWRSNFIQQISQFEPSPSGSGFVMRSRDRLINASEAMNILRRYMDVVFADDVGIERPKSDTVIHVAKMTPGQTVIKSEMAKRAENPTREDNLLKIVSDGRKMSLHGGLYDSEYEEEHNLLLDQTKLGEMIKEVKASYDANREHLNTQLVFCDLGTPGGSALINVYDLIKQELIDLGIKPSQIAFIHTPKNDREREALYARVRSGDVSVLIGSTEMMSEGLNVQDRLSDLHCLVAPWKPSTMEQMMGRAKRYGNLFAKIGDGKIRFHIYTTEGSMDAFMFSTLHNKAVAFGNLLRGSKDLREFSMEVDPTHAEVLALTTDNPLIKTKMETDQEVRELEALKRARQRELDSMRYQLRSINFELGELEESSLTATAIQGLQLEEGWKIVQDGLTKPLFKGEREKLLKVLRKLLEKNGGTLPRDIQLHYGEAKVVFDVRNANAWSLQVGQGSHFKRAADLEDYLVQMSSRDTGHSQRRIEALETEKKEILQRLDAPFERETELTLARRRVFAIEQMINEKITDKDEINLRLEALQNPGYGPIDESEERVRAVAAV